MTTSTDRIELKREIETLIEGAFGPDVRVRTVEDRNRLDVRVTPAGLIEELATTRGDVTVTPYSDFRFTARID